MSDHDEIICSMASHIAAGIMARERTIAGVGHNPVGVARLSLDIAREIYQQQRANSSTKLDKP